MSLFSIQRFGDSLKDEKKEEKAKAILKRLNKNAEETKRSEPKGKDGSRNETQIKKPKEKKIIDENEGERPAKRLKGDLTHDNGTITSPKETLNIQKKEKKSEKIVRAKISSEAKLGERKELDRTRQNSSSGSSDDDVEAMTDDGDNHPHETSQEESASIDQVEPKGQGHREIGGFTVIGQVNKQGLRKVERVLPEWLSRPSIVAADIAKHQCPLDDIQGLNNHLLNRLREQGITTFFPVQKQLMPALLDGVRCGHVSGPAGYRPPDICCSAPTGSGKTLAFVLPIVQALCSRVRTQIRALIVLPTSDLAMQVYRVFQTYTEGTSLNVALVTYGKQSYAHEKGLLVRKGPRGWLSKVDILVATPGRLVDHINNTPGFTLQYLRFLVIDEADRVMEEVKQDWLSAVERVTGQAPPLNVAHSHQPTCCQKLLFSATLSHNPEKLQELKLFQPKLFTSTTESTSESRLIDTSDGHATADNGYKTSKDVLVKGDFIGKYTTPAGLKEYRVMCTPAEKPLLVLYYMLSHQYKHVLCFTNSKTAANRLSWLVKLAGGVEVREMSSQVQSEKRQRILKQFSEGKVQMLICTDALSRGLDVPHVDCVLSYDMSPDLHTYVHRVGRTARAGSEGTAITLVEKKEIRHLKSWLKQAGKTGMEEIKVPRSKLKPYVEPVKEALTKLPAILKSQNKQKRGKSAQNNSIRGNRKRKNSS